MNKKITPSMKKKQELNAFLEGNINLEGADLLTKLIALSVEKTLQEILEQEQAEELERSIYERKKAFNGHRNGYEPGTIKTAEGILRVKLPQIRGRKTPYRSNLWQSIDKMSKSLLSLVQEMYVHGMSQRDVEESLNKTMGQFVASKSHVSVITEQLMEDYELFKRRDLSSFDIAYLFVDTVFEPLKKYGCKKGILCCWAICADGSKILLDLTLVNNESADAILDFFYGMINRGLKVPLTITTDGSPGLIKAVEKAWPRSIRIRCWFHKMQNLKQKVPDIAWPAFKKLVQDIRDAPSKEMAEVRLNNIVDKYKNEFPEACRCLNDDWEASLNHLLAPGRIPQLVRTTNLIERSFVEERRRLKTIPHMWDEKQLTKLVFAVLIRVSDRWNKRQFSKVEQNAVYNMRKEMFGELQKFEDKQIKTKRRSVRRAC